MRAALVLVIAAAACGESKPPPTLKPANDDLVFGTYERRPPVGTTAIKLARDNTLILAHERKDLDGDKPLATGTWKLDKDTLELTYRTGMCADSARTGTYKVVLSKVGVHFTKLADDCAQRAKIDGETWWRVRPGT